MYENIDFFQNLVSNFVLGVQLFQFFVITLSLLLVASYLPRRVESLAFLHRLGFGYIAINFLLSTLDRPIRFNGAENGLSLNEALNSFVFVQGDSALFHLFFIFVTLILLAFFYGTIDRFLLQNGNEIEFPILVIFIAASSLILFYVNTIIYFKLVTHINIAHYFYIVCYLDGVGV
jgi:hypothetical protein